MARILKRQRARLNRHELIRSAGKTRAPVVDLPPDETDDFFAALEETVARLEPAGRQLSKAEEIELARYCLVLAHFEALFRAGPFFDSPLMGANCPQKLSEFLDLCPPNVAKDMAALSRIFGENCGDLIALGADVKQNPTFAGSSIIGGADADFIAARCLWDIKTTIKPGSGGEWIYQLLGYVLLDFEDEYRIREVGIYMARQGLRLQWPLEELLDALCANNEGPLAFETRLAWLRAEFRATLENMAVERDDELRLIGLNRQEERRAQSEERRQAEAIALANKAEKRRADDKERRRLKKLAQAEEKTSSE